jgi:hypothetical protein
MKHVLKNPVKGTRFEKNAKSIMYLGRSVDGEEIWMDTDQVKTHTFLSGSTGSGKTENLIGMITNSMLWGSGALFIDGKGDINFFAKLHLIAKSIGREEDILLLNFMKGIDENDKRFSSHTVNPFGFLSADELNQIMTTMLPKAYGDGAMWQERAIALMSCIINALVWLRDHDDQPLTISEIRSHLVFKTLIKLEERLMTAGAPHKVRSELKFYLESLPGFLPEKGSKQGQVTLDQHGYLSMQWTRTLTLLCSNYGHILDVWTPDIDIRDVILNRRILVILLPSLERSTSDIHNIGALMVGMIKSMLGQALRTPVEGGWVEVVDDRITNARYPFMIFMDEVGQYISDGMGLMAQQARSLNIGLVFSTQDFDSLYASNPRETEAIMANTNTKIFMKAENPTAPQISRTLATFKTEKSDATMRQTNLNSARRTILTDQAHYGRKLVTQTLEDHQKESERLKRIAIELDQINRAHLDFVENDDMPDLAVLLRGFKTGEMLCVNGSDCVQGTSNYVRLAELETPHQIQLEHFVSFDRFNQSVSEREKTVYRVAYIYFKLTEEFERQEAAALDDGLMATLSERMSQNDDSSPNTIMATMLASSITSAVNKQEAAAVMLLNVADVENAFWDAPVDSGSMFKVVDMSEEGTQ